MFIETDLVIFFYLTASRRGVTSTSHLHAAVFAQWGGGRALTTFCVSRSWSCLPRLNTVPFVPCHLNKCVHSSTFLLLRLLLLSSLLLLTCIKNICIASNQIITALFTNTSLYRCYVLPSFSAFIFVFVCVCLWMPWTYHEPDGLQHNHLRHCGKTKNTPSQKFQGFPTCVVLPYRPVFVVAKGETRGDRSGDRLLQVQHYFQCIHSVNIIIYNNYIIYYIVT